MHLYKVLISQNCAFLGYYVARSDNFLPTFRDNLSGPIFRGQESSNPGDGSDRLSRNVSKKLPLIPA